MISHASPLLVATLAQLENLTAEIATLEETVKDRKAYRKYVGENVLPELIGHEQLNDGALMPDGTCVTFEHDYHASIAPKDRAQAHQFLIENGRADLLKCSLTVSLGRNELAKEHVLVNVLRLIPGVEVVSETQLPGPTLMKYVRERLSAGEHLPEYFGVYAPLRAIPRPPPK